MEEAYKIGWNVHPVLALFRFWSATKEKSIPSGKITIVAFLYFGSE